MDNMNKREHLYRALNELQGEKLLPQNSSRAVLLVRDSRLVSENYK